MPAVMRRSYRRTSESIGILRDLLRCGPLTTSQIAARAKANRMTTLGWLHAGVEAGQLHHLKGPGRSRSIWALAGPVIVADPPPEGPRPFEDLVRKMTPGRWHTTTELSAFREQLALAVEADLLETYRRWYVNRPGRPATLYKLTIGGELAAGREPDQWGYPLGKGWP